MLTLLAIVGLGVIILFHEFGHFVAGKLLGIKVTEFMLGLPGPTIFSFKRGETKYGVTALLFGGYVRFAGKESELSFGAAEETGEEVEPERTFDVQPLWKKAVVTISGPVMNLVLPALLVALILSVKGNPIPTTTLESALKGSPAAVVGIRGGDTVVSIKGRQVETWEELIGVVRANAKKRVEVVVERAGRRLTFNPTLSLRGDRGFLGVETRVRYMRELPPVALYHGVIETYDMTVGMVKLLYIFLTRHAGELAEQARGPVGIVYESARIARESVWQFVSLLAFLSINVGIINLFPIPPLDGGRLAIYSVEGIAGRRINRKVVLAINAAGMSLLLLLMFYLVVADIGRILLPAAGGG